jgi:hypothetical protein
MSKEIWFEFSSKGMESCVSFSSTKADPGDK